MHPKINKLFQQLEIQKQEILKCGVNLTIEQFNQKPSPNQWSLGQVFHHLYLVEFGSLQYISKKIQGIDTIENGGVKEAVSSRILNLWLALPIKFKAPKVVSNTMPSHVEYDDIVTKWQATRNDISTMLETLEAKHLKLKIFKHPFSGYLNIIQTLKFVNAHHQHHMKQINNLLSMIKASNK